MKPGRYDALARALSSVAFLTGHEHGWQRCSIDAPKADEIIYSVTMDLLDERRWANLNLKKVLCEIKNKMGEEQQLRSLTNVGYNEILKNYTNSSFKLVKNSK